jgi:Flp pilus assembly protein TadG
MLRRLGRAFNARPRGQALVEFALVVPILAVLLMGTLEVGRMMSAYVLISNGAREGARLGAVQGTSSAITTKVQEVTASLDPSKRTITVTNAQGWTGQYVTVRVVYRFSFIVPLVATLFPSNPFNLTSQAIMRLE